ncbi:MAG: hypothetical protein F6K09_33000 [Merismopedia sp. SIO2A8]|nr:hypothetical protein [Merismopedia sp. SIO2A8]
MPNQSEILKQRLCDSIARPFEDLLPESKIETILEKQDIRYRKRLYTPIVTIWGMVYQVLCADKSLNNTVKWLRHWFVEDTESAAPSSNSGPYSKARSRLHEGIIEQLVSETGQALDQQVTSDQQWCERVVKGFDGSTLLMSDTKANQKKYPQHGNQKQGCGFGMARIGVFFSLVTGVVRAAAIASKTTAYSHDFGRSLHYPC